MSQQQELPEYTHPPVIEVVCGIQFEPMRHGKRELPELLEAGRTTDEIRPRDEAGRCRHVV